MHSYILDLKRKMKIWQDLLLGCLVRLDFEMDIFETSFNHGLSERSICVCIQQHLRQNTDYILQLKKVEILYNHINL